VLAPELAPNKLPPEVAPNILLPEELAGALAPKMLLPESALAPKILFNVMEGLLSGFASPSETAGFAKIEERPAAAEAPALPPPQLHQKNLYPTGRVPSQMDPS